MSLLISLFLIIAGFSQEQPIKFYKITTSGVCRGILTNQQVVEKDTCYTETNVIYLRHESITVNLKQYNIFKNESTPDGKIILYTMLDDKVSVFVIRFREGGNVAVSTASDDEINRFIVASYTITKIEKK